MMKKVWMLVVMLLMVLVMVFVYVLEGDVCRKVMFGDVGWSDIVVIIGVVMMLLDGFGYEVIKMIVLLLIVLVGVKKV